MNGGSKISRGQRKKIGQFLTDAGFRPGVPRR